LIEQVAMQTQEQITMICQTLEVSRAGYYTHCRKQERPRRQQDQQLLQLIVQAFVDSRQTYGSPRLRAVLQRQGQRCGKNRVARLMRQAGLRAHQKRRFRPRTTQSNHGPPIAENWLAKVPTPQRPDQVWVSDITYLPTQQGWLYLAITLDACSRKVVGWCLDESLESSRAHLTNSTCTFVIDV
jgi:transposase InsO family protein